MLSKTSGYALQSILYVAQKSLTGKKIGLKEIAETLKISQAVLGKIMQQLVRHHILKSIKGPNGGFYAPQEVLETPLIKIMEIFDGLQFFQHCSLGLLHCSNEQPCPFHIQLKKFRESFADLLQTKQVKDLKDI